MDSSLIGIIYLIAQPPLLHFINERLRTYPTTEIVHLPELPFLHFLHRIELNAETESQVAAGACLV